MPTIADLDEQVMQRTADLASGEAHYQPMAEPIDETRFRVAFPDGSVEDITPPVQQWLGYASDLNDTRELPLRDTVHPEDAASFDACRQKLIQRPFFPLCEYKIVDTQGHERWIQQSNRGLYQNDVLCAVEGVCDDITAAEQAEMLPRDQQSDLATLQERERIGRDLHDGPSQVMGYVNLQLQAAGALIASGQTAQAEALVNQLANLAQEAHADIRRYILSLQVAAPETTHESWQSALRSGIESFIHHYSIEVQTSIAPELPVDPFSPEVGKEVLQIVHEALNNVRKHAGVNQAQVVVLQQQGALHILVADSGVGFVQAETKQGKESLGLQIMADRTAAIGGSLKISSSPGAGTQVLLQMPLPGDEASWPLADSAWSKQLSALRVLLADDHSLFAEGLSNMLAANGVQVIGRAADGLEVQEMALALRPDVVLMDMNMPHCDGATAATAIKKALPKVKIIVLTAAADHAKLFRALQAGASAYLLKSLDSEAFFSVLVDVLRGEIVLPQDLAQQALVDLAQNNEDANGAEEAANPLLNLSPRQRDILERVAQGDTYKEIAAALIISEATVKYHMGQIIGLLRVENRRQAIAVARQAI